jgi:hypothetical protein
VSKENSEQYEIDHLDFEALAASEYDLVACRNSPGFEDAVTVGHDRQIGKLGLQGRFRENIITTAVEGGVDNA